MVPLIIAIIIGTVEEKPSVGVLYRQAAHFTNVMFWDGESSMDPKHINRFFEIQVSLNIS